MTAARTNAEHSDCSRSWPAHWPGEKAIEELAGAALWNMIGAAARAIVGQGQP